MVYRWCLQWTLSCAQTTDGLQVVFMMNLELYTDCWWSTGGVYDEPWVVHRPLMVYRWCLWWTLSCTQTADGLQVVFMMNLELCTDRWWSTGGVYDEPWVVTDCCWSTGGVYVESLQVVFLINLELCTDCWWSTGGVYDENLQVVFMMNLELCTDCWWSTGGVYDESTGGVYDELWVVHRLLMVCRWCLWLTLSCAQTADWSTGGVYGEPWTAHRPLMVCRWCLWWTLSCAVTGVYR